MTFLVVQNNRAQQCAHTLGVAECSGADTESPTPRESAAGAKLQGRRLFFGHEVFAATHTHVQRTDYMLRNSPVFLHTRREREHTERAGVRARVRVLCVCVCARVCVFMCSHFR